MKRITSLLLALIILLSFCACGKEETTGFRALEVIGTKHYSAICRGGDTLAPLIRASLEVLSANGSLSSISARWLGKDRNALEGDPNAFKTLEEIPKQRTLIFGVETDFNPIAFQENGEVKGMSVDIANAIGALIGWETMILEISADDVAAQLASGNIDCAIGFDSSLVNSEKYSVCGTFLESDILVAVRSDSELSRVKDLSGTRIGTINDPAVLKAVRSSEKVTKYATGATEYLSLQRCISAMDSGWCSAVALDSLMLSYYTDSPGSSLLN